MPKLKFFDVKAKKSFTSDKFVVVTIKGRKFAKVKSPLTGIMSFRIVSATFKS